MEDWEKQALGVLPGITGDHRGSLRDHLITKT